MATYYMASMMLCPRCREPLADPPEPFCPRCGAAIGAAPEAVPPEPEPAPASPAPPPPPPADSGEPPPGIPWDERARIGFATALVDTTVQALRAPGDFYRRMRPTGGVGSALAYALIVAYVGLVATVLYDWIFQAVMGTQAAGLGEMGPEFEQALALMQGGGGRVLQLIVAPFSLAALLFLGAAIDHLALMLLSGARRGFDSTFRVCAFARAASIVGLLPICGLVVVPIWTAVLTIIGLSVVHGISWQKAAAAVLLPLVLFCCCCAGGVGLLASLLAASMR
jgi:hypothetical protein